jgi:tetratricopeptide (TPR) repeat protein
LDSAKTPEVTATEAEPLEPAVVHVEQEKSHEGGDRFRTFLGVMIAIVTVVGALVAWRSAVAGTEAGNADDAGIIAALNAQETNTIGDIISSQNRSSYLDYWRYKQTIDQMAADGSLDNIPEGDPQGVVRQINEASDLATANKQFFESRYLNPDGTFNYEKQRAENLAEESQRKDLNAQQHFDEANQWRDKSLALVAALVLLGISLWLFALGETIEHRVKYVLAAGGMALLLLGAGAAIAIESNVSLPDVYSIATTLTLVVVALVILGAVAMLMMRRGDSGSLTAREEDESPREARFKQAATVLIATVALLGAIAAYLQADAGFRGDSAIRRSQLQAAEALGVQTTGEANVNYHYGGVARTYEELSALTTVASQAGDERAAARYTNIQNGLSQLSELLRPPYFTADKDPVPNVAAYQADQYVAKAATLSEASNVGGNLENVWEDKSNSYVIHLTLLATALALLGLSLTLSGRVRPLFVGVGSAITVVTVVWMALVFAKPVPEIPQAAIDAYGRGVGASYKEDYPAAVKAFDEAVAVAPDYATALYERGGAKFAQGDYEGAIKDYQAAQTAGKDDASVAWDMGYANYLLGRFDEAIQSHRRALELDPKRVYVQLDLAAALLASGKTDEAKAEYQKAKDQISGQVAAAKAAGGEPPPSLLYYLDAGADDLEGLFDQLNDQPRAYAASPPKDKISGSEGMLKVVQDQFFDLKSLDVALEYTGKPPTGTVEAAVEPFQFGLKNEDGTFAVADSFPSETKDIWTTYKYDGMKDGQQVVWKVYLNGTEYPEYRTVTTWDGGTSGETAQALTDDFAYGSTYSFDPGEYVVEMYVDSVLVQRGSFTVEESKTAQ